MVTNRGSRRRNIACVFLGAAVVLLGQSLGVSDLFMSTASAKEKTIYCMSPAGRNSIGAIVDISGRFYRCSSVIITNQQGAPLDARAAWTLIDTDE